MNIKFVRWVILGVLLVTLTVPAYSQTPFPVNLLISGKVELKRPGWLKAQLVKPVKKLGLDDLVSSQQADAKVRCFNKQMRSIPNRSTLVRKLCPQTKGEIIRSGRSLVGSPRGGTNQLIPYIISPRKTLLLSNTPLLHWNSVPNATRYAVRLLGTSGVIWQTEVQQTEVKYPGMPALP